MRARALVVAKLQAVGELDHVQRSRITVQFAGQRQAHAASRAQIGNLLLGQRLDLSLLLPRIRRAVLPVLSMLRERRARECEGDGDDREFHSWLLRSFVMRCSVCG